MDDGIHIEGLSKRYGAGDTAVDALKDVNMLSLIHILSGKAGQMRADAPGAFAIYRRGIRSIT